jgi:hypothetical protein
MGHQRRLVAIQLLPAASFQLSIFVVDELDNS